MPNISLAQWSLNRAFRNGDLKAVDFASIAKNTYDINAVEFVSSLYGEQGEAAGFWESMTQRSSDAGVENLLIMIDGEGDLGANAEDKRIEAVENHYRWVDRAKTLGCHSIRVNAFGDGNRAELRTALIDGLGRLTEYSAKSDINILIENHGLFSSDANFVVDVIQQVNSEHLGTLPDFGNWCTSVKWGGTSTDGCESVFDHAEGVKTFMPYAKGVSAKTYDFDAAGDQPRLDYPKLLKIVKDTGFDGYIGIEYEGESLSEHEGILATKKLIENTWSALD